MQQNMSIPILWPIIHFNSEYIQKICMLMALSKMAVLKVPNNMLCKKQLTAVPNWTNLKSVTKEILMFCDDWYASGIPTDFAGLLGKSYVPALSTEKITCDNCISYCVYTEQSCINTTQSMTLKWLTTMSKHHSHYCCLQGQLCDLRVWFWPNGKMIRIRRIMRIIRIQMNPHKSFYSDSVTHSLSNGV